MKKGHVIAIIVALIGLAGAIIPIMITQCSAHSTHTVIAKPIEDRLSLNFRNWYPYPKEDIQAAVNGNIVTLSGKADSAGYVTEQLSQNLRGHTVILEISNAEASSFYNNQMFKITVNNNDRVIIPLNVNVPIEREYIHSEYKILEFVLPNDFDGKLGFVFYQADLKGLQITATYKSTNP